MFVVVLKFSENKAKMSELMEAHKSWLQEGFGDGVFMVAGGLKPAEGGCILAHGESRAEVEERLNKDPFVVEDVVTVEILELDPAVTNEQFAFLKS